MMQGVALSQGLIQLQQVDHVNSVWLLQQKDLTDVFEHDLVVVGLTMQLCKVLVKLKAVVASRDQHRQILYRCYYG